MELSLFSCSFLVSREIEDTKLLVMQIFSVAGGGGGGGVSKVHYVLYENGDWLVFTKYFRKTRLERK